VAEVRPGDWYRLNREVDRTYHAYEVVAVGRDIVIFRLGMMDRPLYRTKDDFAANFTPLVEGPHA
jgi:hypothetical protein